MVAPAPIIAPAPTETPTQTVPPGPIWAKAAIRQSWVHNRTCVDDHMRFEHRPRLYHGTSAHDRSRTEVHALSNHRTGMCQRCVRQIDPHRDALRSALSPTPTTASTSFNPIDPSRAPRMETPKADCPSFDRSSSYTANTSCPAARAVAISTAPPALSTTTRRFEFGHDPNNHPLDIHVVSTTCPG